MGVCLLGARASALDPNPGPVSVLPLKIDIDPNFRMGRKSSGLLCAPNGSWYWRDVQPNASGLRGAIEAVLAVRGMAARAPVAREFDAELLADLRLRGRVTALSMSGCMPWKPTARLVGGQKIKGRGRLSIVWELYSKDAGAVLWSREISSVFEYEAAASMAAALETGVALNAAALADAWPDEAQPSRIPR